jgi:hypothetical protein
MIDRRKGIALFFVAWPGLTRSSRVWCGHLDARIKSRHDTVGNKVPVVLRRQAAAGDA